MLKIEITCVVRENCHKLYGMGFRRIVKLGKEYLLIELLRSKEIIGAIINIPPINKRKLSEPCTHWTSLYLARKIAEC